jgi:hypothetical protein
MEWMDGPQYCPPPRTDAPLKGIERLKERSLCFTVFWSFFSSSLFLFLFLSFFSTFYAGA